MHVVRGLLHRLALVAGLTLVGGVVVSMAVDGGLASAPMEAWVAVIAGSAFALWVGGLQWLHRIVTMDEGEPPAWRYRDRHAFRGPVDHAGWWSRAIAAIDGVSPRFRMRVLLLAAVGLIGVAVVGLIRSGSLGPTYYVVTAWDRWLAPSAIAGMLVGLAWMVRIYRRLLEDEAPAWRYRDRE